MNSPGSAFSAGVRAVLPLVPGIVPFGMIAGIAPIEAGLGDAVAVGMSLLIFAGASQLAVVQLLDNNALPVVIVLTALVINLRFVMYSASLAPYFGHLPARQRWPLAYLLTDQAYAVSVTRFLREEQAGAASRHWFYLGAGLTMWLPWQLATIAGVWLGAGVPPSWGLDFAIPLTFMALLVPAVRSRPGLVAAIAAGLIATVAAPLPFNLALVLAAVVGVTAGLLTEIHLQRRTEFP
ncbi:MAG: AzlC family ABC transporter permease [Candidatus Competibacterales bacterium]|nr:AzlC family ABC transporter permease [Candidatus Competibacterales bacterium]